MPELLISADAETATIAELSAKLPQHGYPQLTEPQHTVGTKLPTAEPRPPDFVRVLRVGGTGRDLVSDQHTVTLEGWSNDEQRASDLTALAAAIVIAAAQAGELGGVTCYTASGGGVPANLPHPTVTDRFRFTTTISVALRKTTV